MHTIELSKKVRAGEPVMIPAELLMQHVGTNIRIIIMPDDVMNGHIHDNTDLDAELIAIVKRIQSNPMPPKYIKPAEPITQEFVDEFLAHDNNPDFDEAAWNAQWDAHEAEMKELTRRKEREFLEDMAGLFE